MIHGGKRIGTGHRHSLVCYYISFMFPELQYQLPTVCESVPSNMELWHKHLGHASNKRLQCLIQSGSLGQVVPNPDSNLVPVAKWPSSQVDSLSIILFLFCSFSYRGPTRVPSFSSLLYCVSFIVDYPKDHSEIPTVYRAFTYMM